MVTTTIDISANQAHPIDFVKVKASGVAAVFIKATQGLNYVNPYFNQDLKAAIAAGLQVAAYHFYGGGDPAAEAAFFKSVAGSFAKVFDQETQTGTAVADAFLAALNEPSEEEMTYGSASTLSPGINRGLLWPAKYSTTPPGFGQLWQESETGSVPGVTGPVDVSVWTGTTAQWNAFFGITTPTPGGSMPPYLLAAHPSKVGAYWIIRTSDGAVDAFGGAGYYGGGNNLEPGSNPMVKMTGTVCGFEVAPGGAGYYILSSTGAVYALGSARWSGNWQ